MHEKLEALMACRDAFEEELLDTIIETDSVYAADDVQERIDRLEARILDTFLDAYYTGELEDGEESSGELDLGEDSDGLLPF